MHLESFQNNHHNIQTEPLVTPDALLEIGCVRGLPRSPPSQVTIPEVMVVSSGESGDFEDGIVEEEEESSRTSDPDYRGSSPIPLRLFSFCYGRKACLPLHVSEMFKDEETTRAIIRRLKNRAKRPRRGETIRVRMPNSSYRASPPILSSHQSSVSTTVDVPVLIFGPSAPIGPPPVTPTAPRGWPVEVPPSVSLLQGAVVRYGAMGDALVTTQGQLEAETRARLDLESQMRALNLRCEQLAARERRALEEAATQERRAVEEAQAEADGAPQDQYLKIDV
nr:hypothetical protein Iba_chr04fCG10930 [Ipomoea batatas]